MSVVKKYISEDDYNEYMKKANLENGDILFSKAATIGKTAILKDEKIMVWSPLAIIKVNEDMCSNKYLYHLLSCKSLIKYVSLLGGYNTQINVGMRALEKAFVPVPQKYKQSVITEAITQGLDKSVTIVDTDNIHIPTIPTHWKMKKMKYIFEIKKDIAGKEGYDILSITQKGIKIKDISKNEGQLAQNYSNYQLVDIGDFAMNHMDLLTGWVDISKYAGVTSPDYRVFRFIDATGYDADYHLYFMQMCYMNRIFYGLGQGVSNLGRWRLQADKFLNFTIPEPPLKERQEIAKYLSARCIEIDALIAKKESLVEEMEAYKKSLIYEYVTGKKEVL